ncbi:unnamed protein product [Ectocarpus sp. 13 AM-2016]
MLKQGKCHACAAAPSSATPGATTAGRLPPNRQYDPGGKTASPQQHSRRSPLPGAAAAGAAAAASGGKLLANGEGAGRVVVAPEGTVGGRDASGRHSGGSVGGVERPSDTSVLGDPQRAFGYFRERHSGRVALEENKKLLGEKYARAKAMGERVNQARSTIQYLKNTIEQVRRERALDGLMEEGSVGGSKGDDEDRNSRPQVGLGEEEDEEETKCKAAMEVEKRVYKGSFQELRELKSEIEHIQRLLEKGRSKMQADFQAWKKTGRWPPKVVASSEGERRSQKPKFSALTITSGRHITPPLKAIDKPSSGGQGERGNARTKDGANTPTRRPRPPVDAWGTPPASTSHRKGSPSSGATGSVSGEVGGVSNSDSVPTSGGGGRGAWHGGAGGGGLLPPLTGNKEADDDIAAFYRAKEELERRKSAAGRNSGGR